MKKANVVLTCEQCLETTWRVTIEEDLVCVIYCVKCELGIMLGEVLGQLIAKRIHAVSEEPGDLN